jgi:hypothetical protein
LLPYLNADQIIQLKDVIKMREALQATGFAEVALQIRQEVLRQMQAFLRTLFLDNATAKVRFARIHCRRAYINQSEPGWVRKEVFQDLLVARQGLRGAPSCGKASGCSWTMRRPIAIELQCKSSANVRMILYPPHLTRVLLPVDVYWAKQFKAKLKAWQRLGKPCGARAAFQELARTCCAPLPDTASEWEWCSRFARRLCR